MRTTFIPIVSLVVLLLNCGEAGAQMTDVLTYHNDIGRTGQTLHEEVLNLENVNANHFGKLWTLPIDERSLAEPLYVAGVSVPGVGLRNILFVETENDSAYAFDADGTNILWSANLCRSGEQPFQTSLPSINPQIGITSTPVIDRSLGHNGAIFMVSDTQDASSNCFQRLHALDLATGHEISPPVNITGAYPGKGDDSTNGTDYFVPAHYVNRAALLLLSNTVYVAWSAHGNSRPATSWIMGFDEKTLAEKYVLNLEPNSYWGSIWNSGAGPSADTQGNIYLALGNGGVDNWKSGIDSDGFPNDKDYGCCLVKVAVTGTNLGVADYFATSHVAQESYYDWDLGSGSPVVLPDMVDAQANTRQLVVIAGKDQNIFVADRTKLGKWNSSNNNALYQELQNIFAGPNNAPPDNYGRSGGVWSIPAYFNGTLYFGAVRNRVSAFPFNHARMATVPASQSATAYDYPGATPSISASGVDNAIVWTVEAFGCVALKEATNAELHAYAATNLAIELYNTAMAPQNRDSLGVGQKFSTPMVASGKVYLATGNGIAVFGLLDTSTLTPVQQWRNTHFGNPSNIGRGADSSCPADDGVSNLTKYQHGLDPFTRITPEELRSQLNSSIPSGRN